MAGMGWGQANNYIGGAATTSVGAAQTLYGLYLQKHNKRPTYEIPAEIQQNLNQAQQQALQGLPEAQKQQYLDNLQQSTAYSLQQNYSRKGGLTGIAALNQQQIQGQQGLLAQDSAAMMQNQQALYGARNNMADYKGQQFQINQENPYYEKTAQAQALMGAGTQNMVNGFQSGNGSQSGGGGGSGQQPVAQKSYFTGNQGSENGMVNYGGANSPANNSGNGLYDYQGQQFNTGMS